MISLISSISFVWPIACACGATYRSACDVLCHTKWHFIQDHAIPSSWQIGNQVNQCCKNSLPFDFLLCMRNSASHSLWSHSRPQRPRSFWSAPRIATSGQVQHRKSAIHRLPVTLRMFRVKFDKSDCILVPRAHVSFGQHQDTELWNNRSISRDQDFRTSGFTVHAWLGLNGV